MFPRHFRLNRSIWLLVVAVGAALGLFGCARQGPARPEEDATLLLDFAPNAVHAGIFTAVNRGFDDAEGVRLRVRAPAAGADGARLLLAGRADLAVLDIHDLALARERGRDLVGVMALVQRPLAAVLARPGVASPRALEGRRVGISGLASDRAVLRSIVRGAGGDAGRIRATRIGFNAVGSLASGRVAGATAFWNVEGVALRERLPGAREFRVDDFGAPAYPELVLAVTRTTLRERAPVVRAALAAVSRGYETTRTDPEGSISDMVARRRDLDRAVLQAQIDAVGPALQAGAARFGELDPGRLRAWARWERAFGIVDREPDVARAFDARLLPGGSG